MDKIDFLWESLKSREKWKKWIFEEGGGILNLENRVHKYTYSKYNPILYIIYRINF